MRRFILRIALVFLASGQAPACDLSQHPWRHRQLFLVAARANDPDLVAQQRNIALLRNELPDRDIVLFQLLPDQVLVGESALSAEDVRALRARLSVAIAGRGIEPDLFFTRQ